MPDPAAITARPDPRSANRLLPLQGVTILAVEDSRFASEALRLLCQRSGARLRRAETLDRAARHLSLYRPDVVIVDLGLPDGDGADLIRRLAHQGASGPAVLGTSGDPAGESAARAAGAAGFLAKPLEGVAAFQGAILRLLPAPVAAVDTAPAAPLCPDSLALRDDLRHAASLLAAAPDGMQRRYVAGFLGSLAQSARDTALARAAETAAADAAGLPLLAALVSDRLRSTPGPFQRSAGD
jgi:CheY-like chemotaxis protein